VTSVGDRVRRLREEQGLSQQDVAGPGVSYAISRGSKAGAHPIREGPPRVGREARHDRPRLGERQRPWPLPALRPVGVDPAEPATQASLGLAPGSRSLCLAGPKVAGSARSRRCFGQTWRCPPPSSAGAPDYSVEGCLCASRFGGNATAAGRSDSAKRLQQPSEAALFAFLLSTRRASDFLCRRFTRVGGRRSGS
jgi:hypothetical protein